MIPLLVYPVRAFSDNGWGEKIWSIPAVKQLAVGNIFTGKR
ncbi:MAG: hypothetical protein WB502_04775 [Thermoactinomyces sp.]